MGNFRSGGYRLLAVKLTLIIQYIDNLSTVWLLRIQNVASATYMNLLDIRPNDGVKIVMS